MLILAYTAVPLFAPPTPHRLRVPGTPLRRAGARPGQRHLPAAARPRAQRDALRPGGGAHGHPRLARLGDDDADGWTRGALHDHGRRESDRVVRPAADGGHDARPRGRASARSGCCRRTSRSPARSRSHRRRTASTSSRRPSTGTIATTCGAASSAGRFSPSPTSAPTRARCSDTSAASRCRTAAAVSS